MKYVPSLSRSHVEEAARRHLEIWGEGRTEAEHIAHNFEQLERAGADLLRYVGLVDGDHLVASIKRYGMLLGHPDLGVIRAVGIGAVFTDPGARTKGAASALLSAVIEEARDLGCGAAVLYSDIDPGYYARRGFVALPAPKHRALIEDLPAHFALEIRPADPADLDLQLALHAEAWRQSGARLWLHRSPALWRYFRWRNHITGEWILSDGGRDVGYLVAARASPIQDASDPQGLTRLWVDEWAAPGVAADRVWATVRALAVREGVQAVDGWIPPHQLDARFSVRARTSTLPMIAPLTGGLAVEAARSFLSSFEHF